MARTTHVSEKSRKKNGIIKRYLVDKGYGFISAEGNEYFLHVTSISLPAKYRVLLQGEEVTFIPQTKNKRPYALKVTPKFKHEKNRRDLLSEYQEKIESYRATRNKKFLPQLETVSKHDVDHKEIVNFREFLEGCYSPKQKSFVIKKDDGTFMSFTGCDISPDQMKEIILQYICGKPKRSVEYNQKQGTLRYEEEGIPSKPFYKDGLFWAFVGATIITGGVAAGVALAIAARKEE